MALSKDALRNAALAERNVEAFDRALESWQDKHPHWEIEALLWVLNRALGSLRGFIESPGENEISWESPFVEVRFPVDCVWAEDSSGTDPKFHFQTGTFEVAQEDEGLQTEKLTRLMVRHLEISALQRWTNFTAFEKRGEKLTPIYSPDEFKVLDSLEKSERNAVIDRLFRGASFGAGDVAFGEIEDGAQISVESAEQLSEINPPLVFLPVTIDGYKLRVITILVVNSPIADFDTKTAYFPVTVGIALQATEGEDRDDWMEKPWFSFAEWPAEDRTKLWDSLKGSIETSLESLGPKPEPEVADAIVSITSEIKAVVPKSRAVKIQKLINDAIAEMQNIDDVVELGVRHKISQVNDAGECLMPFLEAVKGASSNDEKGKTLEALVSALFTSVEGFKVTERVKTETEEIDVWILNDTDFVPFKNEGVLVLVECKNWAGKCGKNEFVTLRAKVENRKQRCTIGFLVSWNGFAETVTHEMLRGSRDSAMIIPLSGKELEEAVQYENFQEVLIRCWNKALMV